MKKIILLCAFFPLIGIAQFNQYVNPQFNVSKPANVYVSPYQNTYQNTYQKPQVINNTYIINTPAVNGLSNDKGYRDEDGYNTTPTYTTPSNYNPIPDIYNNSVFPTNSTIIQPYGKDIVIPVQYYPNSNLLLNPN